MHTAERRDTLLRTIRTRGYLNVADAAAELGVDTSTVRRDLGRLESAGLIERSHGGAIPVRDEAEVPLGQKIGLRVAEKRAIAHEVARHIPNDSTVLLDAGSSCLLVAQALFAHRGLTVVTPDVSIAAELITRSDVRLILPGGEAVPETSTVLNQEAVEMVRRLHVDVAVMGADAVDARGASNLNSAVVPFKRAMIGSAARTILAVDHSKLNTRRLIAVANLEELALLVTDDGGPEDATADYPIDVVRVAIAPAGVAP